MEYDFSLWKGALDQVTSPGLLPRIVLAHLFLKSLFGIMLVLELAVGTYFCLSDLCYIECPYNLLKKQNTKVLFKSVIWYRITDCL